MDEVARRGRAIVVVSHDTAAIRQLATRAILVDRRGVVRARCAWQVGVGA